jgi:hypothetical protein
MSGRYRRRPKSRIDSERVRIFRCKYCLQLVTYGYGSVDKDGKRLLTNVDGTKHVDREIGKRGGSR